jgi:DNA-binding transcriptional LysR family regulator
MGVATPGLLSLAVKMLKTRSALTTVLIEEGDLARLLPRLRVGELDLFVGRLEPGYAAPDLQTEALYDETMCLVARPDHALARRARPSWADLAALPWVFPPPWASSRIKLNQMFYKHRLDPPVDLIETASFLMTLTFMRERSAIAFVSGAVARYLEREGLAKALRIEVPIELPPVGIITMRNRIRTPACEQMIDCLRHAATTVRKAGGGARARRPTADKTRGAA